MQSHPIRLGQPTWPGTPGWIIDLIWELTLDLYIDSFATAIGFLWPTAIHDRPLTWATKPVFGLRICV